MHLGSLSTARDSRAMYGPFRSGSSLGSDRSHSSVRASVYIHDLADMDEALLNSGPSASPSGIEELDARVRSRQPAANTLSKSELNRKISTSPARSNAEWGAIFQQKARAAEVAGKFSRGTSLETGGKTWISPRYSPAVAAAVTAKRSGAESVIAVRSMGSTENSPDPALVGKLFFPTRMNFIQ